MIRYGCVAPATCGRSITDQLRSEGVVRCRCNSAADERSGVAAIGSDASRDTALDTSPASCSVRADGARLISCVPSSGCVSKKARLSSSVGLISERGAMRPSAWKSEVRGAKRRKTTEAKVENT